jgi:hypothetical protein
MIASIPKPLVIAGAGAAEAASLLRDMGYDVVVDGEQSIFVPGRLEKADLSTLFDTSYLVPTNNRHARRAEAAKRRRKP